MDGWINGCKILGYINKGKSVLNLCCLCEPHSFGQMVLVGGDGLGRRRKMGSIFILSSWEYHFTIFFYLLYTLILYRLTWFLDTLKIIVIFNSYKILIKYFKQSFEIASRITYVLKTEKEKSIFFCEDFITFPKLDSPDF